MTTDFLIINFGGPRSLLEIEPFLIALLTDRDVVRTSLPHFLHHLLFRRIAKKRAAKIQAEYLHMGGASPIYGDTEAIRSELATRMEGVLFTYHRYLPMTHRQSFAKIEASQAERVIVFPMFPQFSYATTGSCARQLMSHLSKTTEKKLHWIKSYATHPEFIMLFVQRIQKALQTNRWKEEETILFFTAHGLPQRFVDEGDPYEKESHSSFKIIREYFPKADAQLAFQSQFGRDKWLRPATASLCKEIHLWKKERKNLLFIPLSFTSDHIETLVEIEQQYMPLVRERGVNVVRMDAFNRGEDWLRAIKNITLQSSFHPTKELIRN